MGPSIDKLIADKKIHVSVSQMIELATIVSDIHKLNFVHSDIKPSNITFDGTHFCLIDFEFSVTAGSTVVGWTEWYAPLEMHTHNKCYKKSDVYSLGVTFLLMVCLVLLLGIIHTCI